STPRPPSSASPLSPPPVIFFRERTSDMKTRVLSSFAAIVLLSLAAAAPCAARTSRSNVSDDALSLVPADAAAVAVVRFSELRTAPAGDYYLLPQKAERGKKGAAAFVSRRLIIVGSEPEVIQALANRAAGGTGFTSGAGALGRQLSRIDRSASAWALVDVS